MEFMTKADYAYSRLRDDILSGKLPGGSKLAVNEIAKEYNLSAMPVRNAITRLEEVGLIKNTPHVGARICEFDLAAYFSLMLLRIEAEAMATMLATLNRTDKTFNKLKSVMAHHDCGEGEQQPGEIRKIQP
jgi:DNA-binding GntR family transcriptional regulator